jgi:hypothetical protein
MKLAILSTFLAGAAAFAPASTGRSGSAISATRAVKQSTPSSGSKNINLDRDPNETGLIGDLPPVGFWDPAGLAERASPEELSRYRECEIMHGRFAQLAVIGMLVPEKYAAEGAFGDDFLAPTGTALEAFNTDPIWVALTFGVISVLETVRLIATEPGARQNAKTLENGLYPTPSPEDLLDFQLKELQHGRLAMLAFAGQIAQELVTSEPLYETFTSKISGV